MDIGADLFLQMMKAIYAGYPEELTKQYKEFLYKAAQDLFAETPDETLGYNAEEFFKAWIGKAQEALVGGESPIDFEIHNKLMHRISHYGFLFMNFMNTVLEAAKATYGGAGSDEKLNEIYNKISQSYFELYQASVGKYLAAPQFGIPRESLHQILSAIDSYHKFMGAVGDFFVKFSMPLKDSLDILQQAITDSEGAADGFKSAKEVYNFVVNILEKRYDDYLKSPEGIQNVVDVVRKYLEYKKKLNNVRDIWFRSLSIPTSREMEDVYRGIYDLKKKTRKQDALIREQNEKIRALNQKVRELEGSLSGSLQKKKT